MEHPWRPEILFDTNLGVVRGLDCEFRGKNKFFLFFIFYFKSSTLWLSR